jgi:glucokinase
MHVYGWENAALATWIERDMVLPCAIANDADAAALAEQRYGAGRGALHLLYLTVSTGIGGGIVIDGKIYRGARAWAGEVGHQVLDPKGPPCACGRNGCLESLASGRGIARAAKVALNVLRSNLDLLQAEDMTPAQHNSSLLRLPIEQITAQTVAEAVATGDVLASTVWERAMTWLGIGIANAANVLNPALVVLGGGLTRAGALLFEPVGQVVAQRVLDPNLKIVPAALGEHIGLLGGAAIAADMLNMSE